jgi:hypothetical protein
VIVELAAIAVVILLPASLLLAILTIIGLGVAGLASTDLDEGRLLRSGT